MLNNVLIHINIQQIIQKHQNNAYVIVQVNIQFNKVINA